MAQYIKERKVWLFTSLIIIQETNETDESSKILNIGFGNRLMKERLDG